MTSINDCKKACQMLYASSEGRGQGQRGKDGASPIPTYTSLARAVMLSAAKHLGPSCEDGGTGARTRYTNEKRGREARIGHRNKDGAQVRWQRHTNEDGASPVPTIHEPGKGCHAERSEASRRPSSQMLCGVYPEWNEWAQGDTVWPRKLPPMDASPGHCLENHFFLCLRGFGFCFIFSRRLA